MFVDRFLQKGAVAGGVATVVEDEGLDSVAMDTACGVDRGRPRLKGAGAAMGPATNVESSQMTGPAS